MSEDTGSMKSHRNSRGVLVVADHGVGLGSELLVILALCVRGFVELAHASHPVAVGGIGSRIRRPRFFWRTLVFDPFILVNIGSL